MGGNKGDRKSYKATSAAKAAEALAAKGAVGFGGFSGIRPVAGFGFGAPAAAAAAGGAAAGAGGGAAAASSNDPLELSAQLDGELAQCLRHLSKRDTTTKLKALQNLEELVPLKAAPELAAALPPWAYQFRRLLLDPARAVRSKAAAVMAALGAAVGKGLLPHLRALLGPWYLACFDPSPDAAAAAKRGLGEVFPGRKQADALAYCRAEVLDHIAASLAATPQSLGDPKKDTPEELQERHERITAASLAAAAAMLASAAAAAAAPAAPEDGSSGDAGSSSTQGPSAAAAALQEVQAKLADIIAVPGFFKKALVTSKSPLVQRSAYGFVQALAVHAPQLLRDNLATAAPAVFGALQDKEPSNHPAMWDMLLSFATSQRPECWDAVSVPKAVVPRLLSLLRHGCHGSAASSLPALLPLLTLLPRQALAPPAAQQQQQHLLLDQVLESLWLGQQQQGFLARGDRLGLAATATAYQECLAWGLRNAAALAAAGGGSGGGPAAAAAAAVDASADSGGSDNGGARRYCELMLVQGHFASLVQLAVSDRGGEADLAADILQQVLLQQCGASGTSGAGSMPVQLQVLLAAVGGALHAALGSACQTAAGVGGAEAPCCRAQDLLDALANSSGAWSQDAAAQLAASCSSALLPAVHGGQQLSEAAANLLARLIREHPGSSSSSSMPAGAAAAPSAGTGTAPMAASSSSSSSIAALVKLGVERCAGGGEPAPADAELLLSCVSGASDPAAAWGLLLQQVEQARPVVAAWRFLDLLLRHFAASGSGSAGPRGGPAAGWSHPVLDRLVGSLLTQVAAGNAAAGQVDEGGSAGSGSCGGSNGLVHGGAAAAHGGRALSRHQAAAASLLGCCLGANKQQQVLLSPGALDAVLAAMVECLSAAQQQAVLQRQHRPSATAGVCVAALCIALESSSHVASSGERQPSPGTGPSPSTSSLWQQQPGHLTQLLLLLWQLSWGGAAETELGALLADADGEGSSSGSSSSSGSGSDSSESESSDSETEGGEGSSDADEASQPATAAPAGSRLGGTAAASAAEWAALQAAAARVWSADLLTLALSELPEPSGAALIQQQQLLLVESLQGAASAAADAAEDGGDAANSAAAAAAAAEDGCRWGTRAAVVVEGLHQQPEQQQALVQQLLAAVPGWQRWCSPDRGCRVRQAPGAAGGGSGSSDPVHALMLQFSCLLLLQAGPDAVLPLHRGHLLPTSREHVDATGAGSSAAATTDSSRRWLRLELLCAHSCFQGAPPGPCGSGGATSASEEGLRACVAAAAKAAERQLLRAAGKGSSGAASAVARGQLGDALTDLLLAAGRCTQGQASSSSSSTRVYSVTLQQLLGGAVRSEQASPAARAHLLPVLERFAARDVATAAAAYAQQQQQPAAAAPAAAGVPAATLQEVLSLCAQAFRFGSSSISSSDAPSLAASGFGALSTSLMRRAAAAAPPEEGKDGSAVLELLQLCVACFPVSQHHHHQQQQGVAAPGPAAPAAAAAAGVSTAGEREALVALLRHVCSSSSSSSSAAATEVQCQLQLCCVSYCWADMLAAEWHIVLRDVQSRLTAARTGVERAAGGLAGAACAAAQQLLGDRGAGEGGVSVPMATQLLRRLDQKGLLQQQQPELATSLADAAGLAVSRLQELAVLPLGLRLLAAVLALQARVQAAGRAPQLGLALAAAWRELLALLLALGAAVGVAGCSRAGGTALLQHCQAHGATWRLLQACLAGCGEPADGEAVGRVLAAADGKVEMLGLDAVGCCLALLQQGSLHHGHAHHHQQAQQPADGGCEPLQQLAWALLLHPASLAGITHAASAASTSAGGDADAAGAGDLPEYGVHDDPAAYLVKVGLRPEMAAGLASARPWQQHLLLWALLLAHLGRLPARSPGQRRLCQAVREVPELVPQLLDRAVGLMGLGGSGGGRRGGDGGSGSAEDGASLLLASPPGRPGGGLSAEAQAALSAVLQAAGSGSGGSGGGWGGEPGAAAPAEPASRAGPPPPSSAPWSLAAALRATGLPRSHAGWRLLAAAVYRAVLCSLPASARVWFSDLRDRARSAAVEAYTSRHESPALLAAEFAAIRRDAAGSGGEVGGSCSFRVVASPASREVTAVLEIEDGATLELVVKLPAAAPLRAPEVDCKNKVGIKDGRLRKWLLSIAVFLRNHNQGVLDGIALWRANLEQEFAGVEACLICYSVISAANGQLPRLSCKQCAVRFHPGCLYKWFRSSGKSACPHCSALF